MERGTKDTGGVGFLKGTSVWGIVEDRGILEPDS